MTAPDPTLREATPVDRVRQVQEWYGSSLQATIGLFSGGNDSTTLIYATRPALSHAAHIVTGTGIPETTEFVERVCRDLDLPLIKLVTPPEVYEQFVLGGPGFKQGGFPGPSAHQTIYWHLKQKRLRELRAMFVKQRKQRVLFVTGIRQHESSRRMARKMSVLVRREGSIVWTNPILDWTDQYMARWREEHDVARNPVCEHLHRSGECLCGAFANPAELDEIAFFYPSTARTLRSLEEKARAAGISQCRWGGSARRERPTAGELCSVCAERFDAAAEREGRG